MTKIEEVIKMVYQLYRKMHNQANPPCPDEETLVCFSESRLSKSESKKIKEHLISCHRCAEIVSLFCKKFEGAEKEVPEYLIKNAKNMVEERPFPNVLEVILALKEKALQILRTTGDIILDNEIIPLPVLRSRQIDRFPEEIKLIKEFENIKTTIHVQKKAKDEIRISLILIDKASLRPLGDLRLALLREGRELESYEAVSGSATFEKISFGRYAIQILRKDEKLGVINLEIK